MKRTVIYAILIPIILLFCIGLFIYEHSYDHLMIKAINGDAKAQFLIAKNYFKDLNYNKAYFWLAKAAESGEPEAQGIVGSNFFRKEKYREAEYWLKKAANANIDFAQYQLAAVYMSDENPDKNYEQALYWTKKSLNTKFQGEAQNLMGYIYYNGLGVPVNDKLAFKYTKQSADNGYGLGVSNLAEMYYRGRGVSQDYTLALALYQKAFSQYIVTAAANIGYMYDQGLGVSKNPKEAEYWYSQVTAEKNPGLYYEIANSFETGKSSDVDLAQAWVWMTLAAEGKYPKAIKRLPILTKKLSAKQLKEADLFLQRIKPQNLKAVDTPWASSR